MGILQFPRAIPATNGDLPSLRFGIFTDNLATVTAAGYLNTSNSESAAPLSNTDVIMALYNYNLQTTVGTLGIFTVTLGVNGITLVQWADTAGAVLPTTPGDFAVFTNATGTVTSAPGNATQPGNISAGLSGTAGTVSSFPAAALKGSLVLGAVANTGNTVTEISNVAMGQASVISIPDPANAVARFMIGATATPFVSGNFPIASGTGGLMIDSGAAPGSFASLTASNVFTGAGQITLAKVNGTEAANAVTASGNAGVITTSALTTAGGASYAITWTNTKITATSVFSFCIQGGTNTTENITFSCAPGAGTATLTIFNNTAATALNGTILIGYTVL